MNINNALKTVELHSEDILDSTSPAGKAWDLICRRLDTKIVFEEKEESVVVKNGKDEEIITIRHDAGPECAIEAIQKIAKHFGISCDNII